MEIENPFGKQGKISEEEWKDLGRPEEKIKEEIEVVEQEKPKFSSSRDRLKVKRCSPEITANIIGRTRAEILKQHGGIESNIPINSPYWRLTH